MSQVPKTFIYPDPRERLMTSADNALRFMRFPWDLAGLWLWPVVGYANWVTILCSIGPKKKEEKSSAV